MLPSKGIIFRLNRNFILNYDVPMAESAIQSRINEAWRVKLRQSLDDRGLEYAEVSRKAGYNEEFLSKVFRGRLNPTIERISNICTIAGIRMAYLFADELTPEIDRSIELAQSISKEEAELVDRLLKSSKRITE